MSNARAESGNHAVNRGGIAGAFPSTIPRAFGQIPLSFSANHGQADPRVKFLSQGPSYKLFLSSAEAEFTLSRPVAQSSTAASVTPVTFKMKLVGGNRKAMAEGLEELPGKSHYFIGNDPKKWRTNVPTYARVKYREVYRGVDLVYYGNQHQLEYDLLVAPRTDPRVIRVSFEGAEKLELAANGDLVASTAGTEFRHLKPVVFQEGDGGTREPVEGRYVLKGRREFGFAVGPYDTKRPLVIDPVLAFSSTGIGGNSIAVDSAGNVYLTGSPSIPTTPGVFQPTPGGSGDLFVAKLNASGTSIVYATNVGGSGSDWASEIEVDAAGNVYIVGDTNSTDFPISSGAFQSRSGGGICGTTIPTPCRDAFVAKLNSSGSALVYSTYAGGTGTDLGSGIEVDTAGNAYVTGITKSADFPVTLGVLQGARVGDTDAFVAKVNPSGTDLIYSTHLGGAGSVYWSDIALGASAEVYVAGNTSPGFPTTPGAFTTNYCNHFVTKLNASGTALVYSSCFTVSFWQDFDVVSRVGVDGAGNAYVSGTLTKEEPGVAGPAPFVLKLNTTGSEVVYQVSLGNMGHGTDIYVDAFGNAYVTGSTRGILPITRDAIQKERGGGICFGDPCWDAFLAKLSPLGNPLYATYLGGNNHDLGNAVAIDSTGGILVTGSTTSSDFPVTPGSYPYSEGVTDFVVRLAPDVSSVSAAHYNISPIARSAIVAAFGSGFASDTQLASSIPLPMSLAATQVRIKDSAGMDHPALLYYVSPTQINFQVPGEVSLGPALVTVISGDSHISTGLMTIASVAPALFTLNHSGTGAAAALDGFTFTGAPFAATRAGGQPNMLALFATGLGADATDDVDGIVNLFESVEVRVDGTPARTLFAGSAPRFVGLNQINFLLPSGISPGIHTVVVSRNGVKSNLVTIAIR